MAERSEFELPVPLSKLVNFGGSMHRTYPRAATRPALKVLVLVTIATASVAGAQPAMTAGSEISTPDLNALVRKATLHNPSVIADLNRWQALQRVPIQARTPPDPTSVSFATMS